MNDDLRDPLILVDPSDRQVGTAEKLRTHQEGLLHRAFSVFLFNSEGKLLLQRRALEKYHSGGLWTNTCCSHPRDGETLAEAVPRRLEDELGITGARCHEVGCFTYRATFDNGLIEHEVDHVFVGEWSGQADPNPREVMDVKWMAPAELERCLANDGDAFTVWLPQALAIALKARASK